MNNTITAINKAFSLEDHDPNERQALASNPLASVWVSASAGTGKTKILTDRVLRLMLPRPGEEKESATPPDRILCLTFTKTAASEMADRIHQRLSEWSVMADEKLTENLRSLSGSPPGQAMIDTARALFARVVDTPGGMKIMTIHSFCQSVLKRFPLEAGLAAHFEVLDDRTALEYLAMAERQVITALDRPDPPPYTAAFERLSNEVNADQFQSLMGALSRHRAALQAFLKKYPNETDLKEALLQQAGCAADDCEDKILAQSGAPSERAAEIIKDGISLLLDSSGKTDQQRGEALQKYFELPKNQRNAAFYAYAQTYLTQKGAISQRLYTKAISTANPRLAEELDREAVRVHQVMDRLKALKIAENTCDLMMVGFEIVKGYEAIKSMNSQLDYDDLIAYTERLLADPARAAWVLYKMDQGIDHVLVDEAQDTSPAQWSVIKTLAEEFFSGQGARADTTRTIFVVGDEKQSIFSFQGADPRGFQTMRAHFARRIEAAAARFTPVNLLMSFRSTAAVLSAVDHIFSNPLHAEGVRMTADEPVRHLPFRKGHAGHIEIWPLVAGENRESLPPWTPPVQIIDADNAEVRLAARIADEIAGWLARKEILTSKDRPVRAGDIMILFRSRSRLLTHVLRALKDRHVPVSGIDRMVLTDHLAVQDCLALAEFSLLPEDDLTLATLLKSPLIGYDETRLFALAHNRKARLWEALESYDPAVYAYLRHMIYQARTSTPYDFLTHVLVRPCPADETGGRRAFYARLGLDIEDALDELLNAALDFERLHTPLLQKFVSWFRQGETEVKREQEGSHVNQVRLMTVHASKGLQAPIVFLPDTVSLPRSQFDVLWPEGDEDLPMWNVRRDHCDTLIEKRIEARKKAQDEEYRRLLYVATTRAEDRLYICGCDGRSKASPQSWYGICHDMMQSLPGIEKRPFSIGDEAQGEKLVYSTLQNVPATTGKPDDNARTYGAPPPDWLASPPPAEPDPPRPLAPSRPSAPDPAVRSPLGADESYRYARGNLIHQLLEYLPELPVDGQEIAARRFLAQPGHNLSVSAQKEVLDEIFKILRDSRFAAIFTPESRAEVPIVGLVAHAHQKNHYAVSGQIDRMVIKKDRILVIDYKTNRPPPQREEQVPAVYLRQMAAYQAVLEHIYPGKDIECALLWTDAPRLMPLSQENLKKHRKI